MNSKTKIAIGIHVIIMLLVLVPPVLLRLTGETLYIETDKMDPRSLFRGHYAILGYLPAQNILSPEMANTSRETGKAVYVVLTTDRPAQFISVGLEKPNLQPGQACIVGRARGMGNWRENTKNESVDFPQIAQFFAPKKEAQELEGLRGENLLAKVKTSRGCNATLVGLEAL